MYKKVTITLPPELAEKWTELANKHNLVKSVMIQNYLKEVLPYLEKREPQSIINFKIEDNSRNLFDYDERQIYDESVEQYKKDKLGK